MTTPLIAAVVLLCIGMVAGRAGRPAPPPLIIERQANSPLFNNHADNSEVENDDAGAAKSAASRSQDTSADSPGQPNPSVMDEMAYTCGARTKKGTSCSRRVYGPVRCWQHKGKPAMLPPDKLIVRE